MSFDPRSLGCKCDECPLKDAGPAFAPVAPSHPKLIVLNDAPPRYEFEFERQIKVACGTFGAKPSDLHITHTILCQPPYKGFSAEEWSAAKLACGPRLDAELASVPIFVPIFALGPEALSAVTTYSGDILNWCGAPLSSDLGRKVLPSFPPAYGLRTPALLPIFRIFFGRAWQLATGMFKASEPPKVWRETNLDMIQALERIARAPEIAVDIEMVPELVLIALADTNEACSIKYPFEDPQVASLVENILASRTEKVLHNANFDLWGLKKYGFVVNGPFFDTILAHAVVGPELPHDLGFACVVESPDPRWKSEYDLSKQLKKIDRLLGPGFGDFQLYNGTDALRTARLRHALQKRLSVTHNGVELFSELTQLAAVALEMSEGGMLVDRERLLRHRTYRVGLMEKLEAQFKAMMADLKLQDEPDAKGKLREFTLGATGQNKGLNRLFFGAFGLRPTRFTEEGHPALDDASLEELVALGHPQASPIAKVVQEFRTHSTIVSRYVDTILARRVDENDVLHPDWKVWGTITGRWSSSGPNAQNWPQIMRDAVVAKDPKHLIVGADFSQLELRIIALLAGDEKLLQWYAEGKDVHTLTAHMLFEEQVAKTGKLPAGARDIAKTVEYAFNYQASNDVTTVWKTAVVQFPFLTIARMQKYRELWFKEHPWILSWQRRTIAAAEKLASSGRAPYIEAPLSGRRRYFHDRAVDPNEVLNFPMQSTAADLCNKAILRLRATLAPGERIIAQVHDAIYVEGPDPDRLARLLRESMTQEVELNGHKMLFPVDVGVARDWTCALKFKDDPSCTFKAFFDSLDSWFLPERRASLSAA